MPNETSTQLKQCFLFRGLPDSALNVLAEKVTSRALKEKETLFSKGDKGDSLFMIGSGWVKIVTEDAQGGELILNQCGPGEAIGEMSLLDEEPRSAGVVALSDTQVLELKRDAFLNILDRNPEVALLVIRGISSRLRFSTTYIEKAIEWSQQIAEGDYSFIEHTQPAHQSGTSISDQDKAGQLLSAFFQMVKGVKAREDELKLQVEKLTLQIDHERRKKDFEELTSTDFYSNLKDQAAKIRQQRLDREKKFDRDSEGNA